MDEKVKQDIHFLLDIQEAIENGHTVELEDSLFDKMNYPPNMAQRAKLLGTFHNYIEYHKTSVNKEWN
jgi:hypothetical protein